VDATAESENFLGHGFRCFWSVPELAQIPILGHERNLGPFFRVGLTLLLGEEFLESGESVGAERGFIIVGGRRGLSESGHRVRVQLELVRHCSNLVWEEELAKRLVGIRIQANTLSDSGSGLKSSDPNRTNMKLAGFFFNFIKIFILLLLYFNRNFFVKLYLRVKIILNI